MRSPRLLSVLPVVVLAAFLLRVVPVAAAKPSGSFFKTLARAPGPAPEWRAVEDRFGRFIIRLPDDWVEQEPESYGDSYNLVAGEAAPRDSFAANLIVTQQAAPDGYRLKPALVEALVRHQTKAMQQYGYAVRDRGFIKLDGIPCVVLGGTMTVNGRELRNLQLRIVYRGINYLMTFTSLNQHYPQYEPLFARLVHSLEFERPDGSWPSPSPSPTTSPEETGAQSASPARP